MSAVQLAIIFTPMGVAVLATLVDSRLAYRAHDITRAYGNALPPSWRWLNIREFAFWKHISTVAAEHDSDELLTLVKQHKVLLIIRLLMITALFLVLFTMSCYM